MRGSWGSGCGVVASEGNGIRNLRTVCMFFTNGFLTAIAHDVDLPTFKMVVPPLLENSATLTLTIGGATGSPDCSILPKFVH